MKSMNKERPNLYASSPNILKLNIFLSIFLLLIIFPIFNWGQNQTQDIIIGEKVTISSKILGEDRTLWIHLPEEYSSSEAHYPVLFLLDGEYYFHYTQATIRMLHQSSKMPPIIIVGIVNIDRDRDLIPTHMDHVPTSGGGNTFLDFIEKELIPYINGHYRTATYRILTGHSFGGLFTVYTLITRPNLFNAYIAVSPSLHWDNGLVLRKALPFFERTLSLKKYLYMAMGNEGDAMLNSINGFNKIIDNKAPADLKRVYTFLPEENHSTTMLRAMYPALNTLYQDWQLSPLTIAQGLTEIKHHYANFSKKFGYETDIPESILNRIGYSLLFNHKTNDAISIFKYNTQLHPNSPNAHDSLGEAYETAQMIQEAKSSYQTALKLTKDSNSPEYKIYLSHFQRLENK